MIPLIVLPSQSCCRISLTCFRWRRHVGWEFFSSAGWQKTAGKGEFCISSEFKCSACRVNFHPGPVLPP